MLSIEAQLPVSSIHEVQLFHKLMGGCCHLTEVETEKEDAAGLASWMVTINSLVCGISLSQGCSDPFVTRGRQLYISCTKLPKFAMVTNVIKDGQMSSSFHSLHRQCHL